MKHIKYIFYLVGIIIVSCAKGDLTSSENQTVKVGVKQKRLLTVNKKYAGIHKDTTLIDMDNYGNYARFLMQSDYIINISKSSIPHMKSNSRNLMVGKKKGCGYIPVQNMEEIPHNIALNGKSLRQLVKDKNINAFIDDAFGSKLKIRANNKPFGKRFVIDLDDPGEELLPSEIHITNPDLSHGLYPLCYYSDFVLGWTPDESNQYGIIIVVEWNGTMIFGEHYNNTSIRCTDLVEDDGETTLNPLMFDGIPDTALCYITVLRGTVVYDELGGTSYSFIADCSETIPFVLIRNIESVQQ